MASSKSGSAAKARIEELTPMIVKPETEDSWEAIARSMGKLAQIVSSTASESPSDIVSGIQGMYRPITSAMTSERTRLSGAAIDLVTVLASELGSKHFDPLLHLFMPTLLALCARTNKVFIVRARTCVYSIIETTQLPAILGFLARAVVDKSTSLRLTVVDGALKCLNCFNPPDLEKDARAADIETIIRATARDASAEIRQASRRAFEAYKLILPNRVEKFATPLSPTTKKYLDIKPSNSASNEPNTRTRTISTLSSSSQPRPQLSSSTSALRSHTTTTTNPPRPPTHNRSTSATIPAGSLAGPSRKPIGGGGAKDAPAIRKDRVFSDMAPPKVPPPKRPVPVHAPTAPPERCVPRSNSAMDTRPKPSANETERAVASGSGRSESVDAPRRVRPPPSAPQPFAPISGGQGSGPARVMNAAKSTSEVPTVSSGSGTGNTVGGARRVPLPAPTTITEPPPRPRIVSTQSRTTVASKAPVLKVVTAAAKPVAVPAPNKGGVDKDKKFKPVSSNPPKTQVAGATATAKPKAPPTTIDRSKSTSTVPTTTTVKPLHPPKSTATARPIAAPAKPALARSITAPEKKTVPVKPTWGGLATRKPPVVAASKSSSNVNAGGSRSRPAAAAAAMKVPSRSQSRTRLPAKERGGMMIAVAPKVSTRPASPLPAKVMAIPLPPSPPAAQERVPLDEDHDEDEKVETEAEIKEEIEEETKIVQSPTEAEEVVVVDQPVSNEEEEGRHPDTVEGECAGVIEVQDSQNPPSEYTNDEQEPEEITSPTDQDEMRLLVTESTPARISPAPEAVTPPPPSNQRRDEHLPSTSSKESTSGGLTLPSADSANPFFDVSVGDSPTHTPISSLVSSIQRGFLFTPSSPMSPPDSYASQGSLSGFGTGSMQSIPFSLYNQASGKQVGEGNAI